MRSIKRRHLQLLILLGALSMNLSWVQEYFGASHRSVDLATTGWTSTTANGGSSAFTCGQTRSNCRPIDDAEWKGASFIDTPKPKIPGVDGEKSKGKSVGEIEMSVLIVQVQCVSQSYDINKEGEITYQTDHELGVGVRYWEKDNKSEAECVTGNCFNMVLPGLDANKDLIQVEGQIKACLEEDMMEIAKKKRIEELKQACEIDESGDVISGWDNQLECKIDMAETKEEAEKVYDELKDKLLNGSKEERLQAMAILKAYRDTFKGDQNFWAGMGLLDDLGHYNQDLFRAMDLYNMGPQNLRAQMECTRGLNFQTYRFSGWANQNHAMAGHYNSNSCEMLIDSHLDLGMNLYGFEDPEIYDSLLAMYDRFQVNPNGLFSDLETNGRPTLGGRDDYRNHEYSDRILGSLNGDLRSNIGRYRSRSNVNDIQRVRPPNHIINTALGGYTNKY